MSELLEKLAPALIGFVGTMVGALVVSRGWYMSHKLTVQREVEAKRREQHLNYLVQAYRTLSKVKPYNEMGTLSTINAELQQALADIQFLGNSEQVAYAQKFAAALKDGAYDLDPLLKSLRDELRKALGKSEITGNIWWLTITEQTGFITTFNMPPHINMGE